MTQNPSKDGEGVRVRYEEAKSHFLSLSWVTQSGPFSSPLFPHIGKSIGAGSRVQGLES